MDLKKIYKRLPVDYQRNLRPIAQKIYFLICALTFRQALLEPIGKVGISIFARPFMKRSASQQGEDLILDRLLSRLLGKNLWSPGIYVDVGAYHAIDHSVTYLLYKRGWQGIAFDPSTQTEKSFKIWRPRDTFICKAVGEADKVEVSFYTPINASNMSLVNTKYPEKEADYRKILVQQVNLTQELKRHNISKVDVLNVDIEGAEMEVLKTFDFDYFKPSIVAIEIHGNDIQRALATEEAVFLLSRGYRCTASAVITYFFVREDSVTH